jgi:hypothetical protein
VCRLLTKFAAINSECTEPYLQESVSTWSKLLAINPLSLLALESRDNISSEVLTLNPTSQTPYFTLLSLLALESRKFAQIPHLKTQHREKRHPTASGKAAHSSHAETPHEQPRDLKL